MADAEKPLIRVIDFFTLPEEVCKTDKYGEKVLDKKGKHVLELQDVDWVRYAPAHGVQSTQNEERIRHIIPGEPSRKDKGGVKHQFMTARWSQIQPAYDAWKQGNEIPVDGTPFSHWPGITQAQSEAFKKYSIRTVEDVKNMTESQIDRVRLPNVKALRKSAIAFLANSDTATVAAKQVAQDKRIDQLEEQLEAALELAAAKVETGESKTDNVEDEVKLLRAELEAKGIDYHPLNNAETLRELLSSEAA